MRLIDADALIEMAKTRGFRGNTFGEVVKLYADEMPTIEERKTGKWMPHPFSRELDVCTACGVGCKRNNYLYCPNCGAKMEGGKDE